MKRQRSAGKQYPGQLASTLPRVGPKTLLYADYEANMPLGPNNCTTSDPEVCAFVAFAGTAKTGVHKGDEHDNRDGERIRIKKIDVQFDVETTRTTGVDVDKPPTKKFKVWIVLDKQHNQSPTVPTATDLLNIASGKAFVNLGNRKRYKILKEWTVTTKAYNGSSSGHNAVANYVFEGTHECDIPIDYLDKSINGSMNQITANNLYTWVQPCGIDDVATKYWSRGAVRFYYTT